MNKEKFFDNVASLKFLAKHEVGQNFLIDPVVCERIVDSLSIKENDKVLEIGCGAGSLSFFLANYSNEIDLIDIDEGLLTKVTEDFKDIQNVHPKKGNAMDFDYSSYTKIIGNLPYYITSGIIEEVLLGAINVDKAIFMVQKEAANRLLVKQGGDDVTPLTLYLNYVCNVKRLFNVGRNSFVPIPHVESTVLELDFNKDRHSQNNKEVYQLTKRLFLNKRKTILNNLKNNIHKPIDFENVLKIVGIETNLRPQDISFEKYSLLYSELSKY